MHKPQIGYVLLDIRFMHIIAVTKLVRGSRHALVDFMHSEVMH